MRRLESMAGWRRSDLPATFAGRAAAALLQLRLASVRGESGSLGPSQPLYQVFEDFAPVLVISELVEAGAGGSEQHDISRLGIGACTLHGVVERFGMHNLGRVFNLRFNLLCCCADGIDALYSLAQKIVEDGVVAAFVFSSDNKMDVRGK